MQDNQWKEQLDDFTSQARNLRTKVETLNRKIDRIRYKDTAGVAEQETDALTGQITNYQERINNIEQAIISVTKIREEREAEAVIRVEDSSLEREQYHLVAQEVEESITFTTALDKALFDLALKKLNDKKKEIRCLGVTGMEQTCHKYREAVYILIPFLQDPEGDVRTHVLNSLIKLEVKESFSKFVEALDDESVRVRLAGVRGIYKFAGSSAAHYLVYALRDKSEEVRERTALYLGRCCGKNAIPEFFALFYKEQDSSMRKALLQTISAIKDVSAIPYFIRILNDADIECRKLAALALDEWTGKTFDFNPNAPIVDRERSITKYEQWWNRNKERFEIMGGALSIRQKRVMEQATAEREKERVGEGESRRRREREQEAKAERERLRAEQEAKEKAERERLRAEQEVKEKAERERLRAEQEAKAKAERERIKAEKEARAKVEQKRIKTEKEKMKKSEKKKKRLKPDSKVKTVRKKKIQKRNKKETSKKTQKKTPKKTQKRKPKGTRRLDTDALL